MGHRSTTVGGRGPRKPVIEGRHDSIIPFTSPEVGYPALRARRAAPSRQRIGRSESAAKPRGKRWVPRIRAIVGQT